MKTKSTLKLIIAVKFFLLCVFANAQGLENIIVEKYYISDLNDSLGSVGDLPVGSVTYRVWADLLPGYRFQALYGVPTHTLVINTTTAFFNNEDRGATTPTFTKNQARNNTVMLDSWFSVNGAASNALAIPKTDDDGVANAVNLDGLLANTNPLAGIPLTTQDGFYNGTPGAVTFVGLSAAQLEVFDAVSNVGNSLITNNASIACLVGSTGADPNENKVLLGQFTTNGTFHFEFNIQIGTPTPGVSENYVVDNPAGNEMSPSFMVYTSDEITTNVSTFNNSSANKSFKVYPNPSTDKLYIDVVSTEKNSESNYKIYDVVGKMISQKNNISFVNKYAETLDISSLPKGVYFIELTVDGTTSTKKIIKN
jgi:hypothetical protein